MAPLGALPAVDDGTPVSQQSAAAPRSASAPVLATTPTAAPAAPPTAPPTAPARPDHRLGLDQHATRRHILQDMRYERCPAWEVAPPSSSWSIAGDRAVGARDAAHSAATPPSAPVAAGPGSVRCFAVDLARTRGGALGCRLAEVPGAGTRSRCLRVVSVREESGLEVHEWNVQCRATSSADAVAEGDVVVRVNDVDRHAADMLNEFRRYAQSTTGELLMVMQRVSHESARERARVGLRWGIRAL